MSIKNILYIWYLAKNILHPYKFKVALLIVLGFLDGLLEGLGVAALIPLFALLSGDVSPDNIVVRMITAIFSYAHVDMRIRTMLFFIAILFIFKSVILFLFTYIRAIITSNYLSAIRSSLHRDILFTNWPYLSRQKLGYLENVLMVDAGQSSGMIIYPTGLLLAAANFITYLVVAFSISWEISLITTVLGLMVIIMYRPLYRKLKRYSQTTAGINKTIAHDINENMIGLKVIKAVGVEHAFSKSVSTFFDSLNSLQIKGTLVGHFMKGFIEPLSVFFILIMFAISYYQPGFQIASFAVIVFLIHRIFIYVGKAAASIESLAKSVPFIEHVVKFQKQAMVHREISSGKAPFVFEKEIKFNSVSFSYQGDRKKSVLAGIAFTVRNGQMLGIVGLSGAGKTTLADILLRLFEPTSGSVSIDGKDISMIDILAWRRHIGYVPQEIFLKNDTVANNIKFYDESVTEDDMVTAARTAHIYDVIQQLPHRFNTIVGERGVTLSGGERQRIALARALARKPSILILDEATSNIDSISESLIKKSLSALKGEMTIIAIAHRFSTVLVANHVIVLEEGAVKEEGSPEDLLANKESHFYKMYRSNLGEE